jgi:hypothetical protein
MTGGIAVVQALLIFLALPAGALALGLLLAFFGPGPRWFLHLARAGSWAVIEAYFAVALVVVLGGGGGSTSGDSSKSDAWLWFFVPVVFSSLPSFLFAHLLLRGEQKGWSWELRHWLAVDALSAFLAGLVLLGTWRYCFRK